MVIVNMIIAIGGSTQPPCLDCDLSDFFMIGMIFPSIPLVPTLCVGT